MTSIKYAFFFIFILIVFSLSAIAQQLPDSSVITEEVIVEGYPDKVRLLESPASVGIVNKHQLANQPGFTLVPALNMVSGVRMEERSPGSYRLSVRGSLLRSPFGIRNIKIYLDEFPVTDAGGNSYLNLIDGGAIKKMEILKGPHGSMYGANTGGVIIASPFQKVKDSLMGDASVTVGSYGLFHQKAGVDIQFKKHRLSIYEAYQYSNGYRENSALQRKYIHAADVFHYHKNLTIKAFCFYSELNYRTPGGLTLKQYQDSPASARPASGASKGAIEQKAGITNKTIYSGIAHEAKLSKNLRHVAAVFASHTDFKNPFITNYEERKENTVGARTYIELSGSGETNGRTWKWNTGAEWQATMSTISNYGNRSGTKDTLQKSTGLNARQYFIFSQFSGHIGRLALEAGLSFNNYAYGYRSLQVTPLPTFTTKIFSPQWMPRIAMSYRLLAQLFWRASVSKGYSPPTLEEIRPSDVTIHSGLQPESGWNYETGIRYQNQRFGMDAVVFYYNLQNAIVRRQDINGNEYFINAGGTNQPGLEWQCHLVLLKPQSGRWITSIELTNSFTWYRFSFSNYKSDTIDFSGKGLTGVPRTVAATGLYTVFAKGIYTYIQYNYTSAIPLNDQNTENSDAYHLLQVKAGWKFMISAKSRIELYGGIDNLLNVKYSLGNDLNAVRGRYYNSAPLRNYYGGIGFSF